MFLMPSSAEADNTHVHTQRRLSGADDLYKNVQHEARCRPAANRFDLTDRRMPPSKSKRANGWHLPSSGAGPRPLERPNGSQATPPLPDSTQVARTLAATLADLF